METEKEQKIDLYKVRKLPLGAYDFVVHYAELLDEFNAEFCHSHAYMEMFYIQSGELTILVKDEEVSMKSGDIMIVPPLIPHHVQNIPDKKKTYFVMVFEFRPGNSQLLHQSADLREIHQIDTLLQQLPQNKYVLCSTDWDASAFFDQIAVEYNEKRFGWKMYTNMLHYGFFLHALRYLITNESDCEEADDALNLAVKAIKYIHAHYAEDISLETLAAYLFISQRHANRIFHKMFNTTFGEALRALRLTYAKSLLTTTELSDEEIAEKVGFSSSFALRKHFKQNEGITISQYRNI